MFLVTGATGHVGGEVVRALVGRGEPVRALVRDVARTSVSEGVELRVGDLNQPETLTDPLAGVRGVFLLSGYADMRGILDEVARAGVERVVLLSGTSAASGDTTNAISANMIRSEAAVRETPVSWTILRPAGFFSNTLDWAPQIRAGDVVRAPFAGVAVAMIDPADIAAVAETALVTPGHVGQTYFLTGPAPLLPADRVRVLAETLGRNLRFEHQPDAEARTEMSAAMPAEYVDAFFDFSVGGALDESHPLPTVQEITGRPPRSFEQWARAHADAFA